MDTRLIIRTIHNECDETLARCGLVPLRDEEFRPFAVAVFYANQSHPRFQVQISGEDDIVTRSVVYDISVVDTIEKAETYPNVILEAVFDDDSYVRDYGLASAKVIYDIYGCKLFSEKTLLDPRIPWFKGPPTISA